MALIAAKVAVAVWPIDLWSGAGLTLLFIVLLMCVLSFMWGMHVANAKWIERHHGNRPVSRAPVVPQGRKEER